MNELQKSDSDLFESPFPAWAAARARVSLGLDRRLPVTAWETRIASTAAAVVTSECRPKPPRYKKQYCREAIVK